MEFLRPGLLWTLAAALLALLVGLAARRRSRRELSQWVGERHLARFVPGHSPARAGTRLLLASLGLLLVAAALLGPVVGHTLRPVSRRGLDLVVCLDTSRSMLAQDLRPSRLERARREIVGLLDRMAGDRVALVAFSGEARDIAPLTRDRATLESLLTHVSPEDNQKGGTDLAAAIQHALELFDGRSGAHEAIVLITDGEDLEGQGLALAERAKERGIRLFVLGVGTLEGGKIPVVDASGKQSFLVDENGQEVLTRLDRASLVELARRTGGEFLAADESATPLEDLYRARITRLEGRELTSGERRVPYDRYQWPLAGGLLLLCLSWLMRREGRAPAARAEGPRLAAALCALPLAWQAPAQPTEPPAQRLARAADLLATGELAAAEQSATALLAEFEAAGFPEPARARAQLALGVIRAAMAESAADEATSAAAHEGARASLGSARALAGAGALRLAATYDLGTLELLRGERWRAQIPEISGQPAGPPGAPPASPGGPPDGPPPPDPLAEARRHYLEARTWFAECLKSAGAEADTRANLELLMRRLRELERIEQEREKQKQEQQDQQDQQDEDQQEQEDQDQKDQEQENEDQKDPQQDGQEKRDPKNEDPEQQDPEQQDPEQEQQPEDETKSEAGQEPKTNEQEPQSAQPSEERVLTREEVMQLLDRLGELEKQQKALEAALRAKRNKAKRDW